MSKEHTTEQLRDKAKAQMNSLVAQKVFPDIHSRKMWESGAYFVIELLNQPTTEQGRQGEEEKIEEIILNKDKRIQELEKWNERLKYDCSRLSKERDKEIENNDKLSKEIMRLEKELAVR